LQNRVYCINLIATRRRIGTSKAAKHDVHMLFGELAIGGF
jgi:hypothetical protein